mmetsp:Transcript_83995/g.166813  ORF Transcript_83995/g.166813 Transcript_83995/m.166813 type:complete len:128 (-) Transcript_83995:392-775(-)|eukprot:CAMPEP_0172664722 /NCGR_PEP_ID=MMETSP1074-20121228/6792_1 /TAXON_ID=2916 /ORGANISM="Ceratium fusus, Strain PA161109" /LENGTH=127 /DNA_ID=CAMNT_0013480927 /DNA_START=69 /DNA_END=452 /DNA_ORIENTATION=+
MCITKGVAAYLLPSIVVFAAISKAQNVFSASDSMQKNALGIKMNELITLTNDLERRAQKEGDEITTGSKKMEDLQTTLADVEEFRAQKEEEKRILSDKICTFADEVGEIKKEYDKLLSWTEELGKDD